MEVRAAKWQEIWTSADSYEHLRTRLLLAELKADALEDAAMVPGSHSKRSRRLWALSSSTLGWELTISLLVNCFSCLRQVGSSLSLY